MARVYWDYIRTETITSFTVSKSTNRGHSYTDVVTIPFNRGGAFYDKQRGQFFYDDAAGVAGDVYRIITNDADGPISELDATYVVNPPPAKLKCCVMGYVADDMGNVDRVMPIIVQSWPDDQPQWQRSQLGHVSESGEGVLSAPFRHTIYPDENGMWQVMLVQGCRVRFTMPAYEFDVLIVVPSREGPVNLKDIPTLSQASYDGLFNEQGNVRGRIVVG